MLSCWGCAERRAGSCFRRRLRGVGTRCAQKVMRCFAEPGGGGDSTLALTSLTKLLFLELQTASFFGVADLIEARVDLGRARRVLRFDDSSEEAETWAAGVTSPSRATGACKRRWRSKTTLRSALLGVSCFACVARALRGDCSLAGGDCAL